MEYRQLGNAGVRVSTIGLGTNRFGSAEVTQSEVNKIIDAALDGGINFIDSANVYNNGRSEETLGNALKGRMGRVVMGTKFSFPRKDSANSWGASRYHMMQAVEQSLRRLQSDHIDLYYCHRWDDTTPIEETLRGLDDLVRSGKVQYAGICNTPAWRISQMQTLADLRGWTPFVALQIEYSLVERSVEHELIPMAAALGLGVLPWSPLGGGILTGKYGKSHVADSREASIAPTRKGIIASSGHLNDRSIEVAEAVSAVAEEIGATPSQVAIAWTLTNPAVTAPVIGARTLSQAADNLGALDLALSPAHVDRLNRASAPDPIFPARFVGRPMVQQLIFGGASVAMRG